MVQRPGNICSFCRRQCVFLKVQPAGCPFCLCCPSEARGVVRSGVTWQHDRRRHRITKMFGKPRQNCFAGRLAELMRNLMKTNFLCGAHPRCAITYTRHVSFKTNPFSRRRTSRDELHSRKLSLCIVVVGSRRGITARRSPQCVVRQVAINERLPASTHN